MSEEEYMDWQYFTELPYVCCMDCDNLGERCTPKMAMFLKEEQCEDFKART